MAQRESAYADEGTLAHQCAEEWITGKSPTAEYPQEMKDHVGVYVNHLRDIMDLDPKAVIHVEQRVHVTELVNGTMDAGIWLPSLKEYHVRDLKYGAGLAVSVDSLQVKIYGLGALLTMNYPAEKIVCGIVQPRCYHEDGPIRTIEYHPMELMEFYADLLDAEKRVIAAERANDLDPYISPSEKGCRWCLAAPKCPALRRKANEAARKVFSIDAYDPRELSMSLDEVPLIEAWCASVREFAYKEAEQGKSIPNYKLVDKQARRKWRDDPSVLTRLKKLLGSEAFDIKPKPLTTVEKMLSKEDRAVLAELTVKESSGHVLVHESDKRPAVNTDAKSAFSSLLD
jgi:hypothetical protein